MKHFNLHSKNTCILIISIGLILLFSVLVSSNLKGQKIISRTGFYFNTIIEIDVYKYPDLETANKALSDALQLCQKYENLFSRTNPGSEIYKINESQGTPVKVSPETISLVELALLYADESDDLVTPSIGALTTLWDYDAEDFVLPEQYDIDTVLQHIDKENILIDNENSTITLTDNSLKLDLGFIAKGYIADCIKELLIGYNIEEAIINLGGNVVTIDTKSQKRTYNIGIKNPKDPSGSPITAVSVCGNKSIVSSGDYERYFESEGHRYHHILSTKNGYPVSSDLSQVTIISDSSTEGDALSTLCFILGYEKAQMFLKEHHPDVKAIFVDSFGNLLD